MSISLENFQEDSSKVDLTSPRSVEACSSLGILPHELLKKSLQSFQEAAKGSSGIEATPDFIARKCRHYEQKRQAKLEMALERRQELINSQSQKADLSVIPPHIIAQEKYRADKLKKRQRRQVQKQLAIEIKRQTVEDQISKDLENKKMREKSQSNEAKERVRQWEAAQQRMKEEKARKDAENERRAQALLQQMADDEMRLEKARKEAQAKRQAEVVMKDRLRQKRTHEIKITLEKMQKETEEAFRAKEEHMRRVEEARAKQLAEQKKQMNEESALQMAYTRHKIQQLKEAQVQRQLKKLEQSEETLQQAEERKRKLQEERESHLNNLRRKEAERFVEVKKLQTKEEQQRLDMYNVLAAKDEEINNRIKQREEQLAAEKALKDYEAAEREKKRLELQKQQQNLHEAKIEQLQNKMQAIEDRAQSQLQDLKERLEAKQAEQRLIEEDRREHLARIERVQEYERGKLEQKVQEEDQRAEEKKQQQNKIRAMRQALRHEADMEKAALMSQLKEIKDKMEKKTAASVVKDPDFAEKFSLLARPPSPTMSPKASSPKGVTFPRTPNNYSAYHGKHHRTPTHAPAKTPPAHMARPTKSDRKPLPLYTSPNGKRPQRSPSRLGKSKPLMTSKSKGNLPRLGKRNNKGLRSNSNPIIAHSRSTGALSRQKQNNRRTKLPQNPQRKAAPAVAAAPISNQEAEIAIEELAAEQNGYLLLLVEKEQNNEAERQKILAQTDDGIEKGKLEAQFDLERTKASEIIKAITQEHETTLQLKMEELGLLSGSDDENKDESYTDSMHEQ